MEPEARFVKYAFPCAFILRERGEISEEELNRLERAAVKGERVSREFLERVFFRAVRRMQALAQEMRRETWDDDVVHAYFVERHNEIIGKGMEAYARAPESLRELCKVHSSTILEIKDHLLIVKYGNKIRPVMGEMIPAPRVGERVTIHYGYAIERLP